VATVKADAATLNKLLAADLQYIHSNAEIDTRASFIEKMKTGFRTYQRLDHEGMEVRLYGDTAVLTATAQVITASKGQPAPVAHLRFIHVWVYKGGAWQMVAHQSLRLPN
jgi:ketosteroid isomerase-like protein